MARLYGHRDARWSPKARSNGSKCSATWMFCRANVQVKWVHLKLVFQLQLAVGRWRCHASHPAMDVLTFLLLLETEYGLMDWWFLSGDHGWSFLAEETPAVAGAAIFMVPWLQERPDLRWSGDFPSTVSMSHTGGPMRTCQNLVMSTLARRLLQMLQAAFRERDEL